MRVLVFGTFDHLHPGHRFLFDAARTRGDLSVVVARDANVLRFKGKPAAQDENERRLAIQNAYPDAQVLLGDPEDFLAPVRAVHPDLILLGYDQRLPPGVREEDFPCPVQRAEAFRPDMYKTSLRQTRNPS